MRHFNARETGTSPETIHEPCHQIETKIYICCYSITAMAFDPSGVIDSFVALDSLPSEAKTALLSLKSSLAFAAPELGVERLFFDFKSQKGLSSILNQHASGNDEAMALFRKALASIPK